jgi:iron-sulfur cluster assembly protein
MAIAEHELDAAGSEEPIVALTDNAIKQVKRQMAKTGQEGKFLRLGVRGGGCSGLSYVIDFDDEADPEFDRTYTVGELNVVVDRKSALYLKDTTLDYNIKNLMEGGFRLSKPERPALVRLRHVVYGKVGAYDSRSNLGAAYRRLRVTSTCWCTRGRRRGERFPKRFRELSRRSHPIVLARPTPPRKQRPCKTPR